jgi:cytochrome P450
VPSLLDIVSSYCLLIYPISNLRSFLLVRHPQVMERLRVEVASMDGSGPDLSRDDLKGMPYLQNILKESMYGGRVLMNYFSLAYAALRLYPSVPVNTRTAVRTTVLPTGGGLDRTSPVLVPKGSAVAFSVYSMHRRPDLYGMDAELFRPERWDEDMPLKNNPTNNKWGYLPFHGGPRACLGSEYPFQAYIYRVN